MLVFQLFVLQRLAAQSATEAGRVPDKARQWYEESTALLTARKYDQAIATLQRALEKAPDFADAHFRLGRTYEVLRKPAEATKYFENALRLRPANPVFREAHLTVGQYYLSKGNYADARRHFADFASDTSVRPGPLAQARRGLATCDFAAEATKNPLPFSPKSLGSVVNGFTLQYFPALTVDQQTLIFTGRNLTGERNDENIYLSTRQGDDWTPPVSLSDRINTAENEGTCSISADGRILVFTNCQGRRSFGSCDLFVSYKVGNEWSEPLNLGPKINTHSWESQPTLSADGRTLYFVSDRRGGYGKRDIWVSQVAADGQWGPPTNLGPVVNTPEDDLSPFLHANGRTLFFSSQGQVGLGGFDLFFTQKQKEGTWDTPRNLGYPLNTFEDQVSLFVTADGKKGYYAHETSEGDRRATATLQSFDIPPALFDQYDHSAYLKGTVYDARTRQPIANAKVEVYNILANQLESVVQTERKSGEYVSVLTEGAQYALYVNQPGYLFKSLSFDFSTPKAGSGSPASPTLDIYLEPIVAGAKEVLNNIFFATARFELELKSQTELDKITSFLRDNPRLTLEIAGHTDDVGNEATNAALSQKRARSLYDYLIKAGIAPQRLRHQGYGKTRPLVPNTSEANRALNRRIELRVLEEDRRPALGKQ